MVHQLQGTIPKIELMQNELRDIETPCFLNPAI